MAVMAKIVTTLAVLLLRAGANPATVVDVVVNDDSTSTLEAAVIAANLVGTLSATGPYTLFAPTNAAFDALPLGTVTTLLLPVNLGLLTEILTYHVVNETKILSGALAAGPLTMANGVDATIATDPAPKIDTALVTTADKEAGNGVVHIIDAVLVPAGTALPDKNIVMTAAGVDTLRTLVTALTAANLLDALGSAGLTVFAPTNTAFSDLGSDIVDALLLEENVAILTAILEYHVSPDVKLSTNIVGVVNTLNVSFAVLAGTAATNIQVDGREVGLVSTDIRCAGTGDGDSIVHIIDKVLLPPWFSTDLLQMPIVPGSVSAARGLVQPVKVALLASVLMVARWFF